MDINSLTEVELKEGIRAYGKRYIKRKTFSDKVMKNSGTRHEPGFLAKRSKEMNPSAKEFFAEFFN